MLYFVLLPTVNFGNGRMLSTDSKGTRNSQFPQYRKHRDWTPSNFSELVQGRTSWTPICNVPVQYLKAVKLAQGFRAASTTYLHTTDRKQ
jgi:hypothetical protein